jgi:hypothetical protein
MYSRKAQLKNNYYSMLLITLGELLVVTCTHIEEYTAIPRHKSILLTCRYLLWSSNINMRVRTQVKLYHGCNRTLCFDDNTTMNTIVQLEHMTLNIHKRCFTSSQSVCLFVMLSEQRLSTLLQRQYAQQ